MLEVLISDRAGSGVIVPPASPSTFFCHTPIPCQPPIHAVVGFSKQNVFHSRVHSGRVAWDGGGNSPPKAKRPVLMMALEEEIAANSQLVAVNTQLKARAPLPPSLVFERPPHTSQVHRDFHPQKSTTHCRAFRDLRS